MASVVLDDIERLAQEGQSGLAKNAMFDQTIQVY